jgi:hypothetical protein
MRMVVAATLLAASLAVVAAPATAHADPVPTPDEVVAVLAELTDPNIPAANKGDIVTPGFAPDEAGTIDDHLHRMDAHGRILPLDFVVTDMQPAPNNLAGATLATNGTLHQATNPRPIVLVDQGGHWLIAHESAMAELDLFWRAREPISMSRVSLSEQPQMNWIKLSIATTPAAALIASPATAYADYPRPPASVSYLADDPAPPPPPPGEESPPPSGDSQPPPPRRRHPCLPLIMCGIV